MHRQIITYCSFILAALAFTGCKDYLDINADPYAPQTAPPDYYLPQIIYAMAEGEMFDSRYVGSYTQNWVNALPDYFYERHGSSYTSGTQKFRNNYWSIGSDLNEMVTQAQENNQPVYEGIAKVIRAWSWQVTTDHHGELPYQQAWDNTRTSFEYDSQEFIYGQIQILCDEGIAVLQTIPEDSASDFAAADYLYEGDISRWIKFAYAIKARNAGHLTNKSTFKPDDVISFVDQSFQSIEDNPSVFFIGESSANSSFMGPIRGNFNTSYASKLVISYLDGTYFAGVQDPRLPLMFNADSVGIYHGLVPTEGDTAEVGQTLYGKYIFTDSKPYPLMTYPEIQFIKAEAAFIKGDLNMAYTAFLEGVRSHMLYAGVASAAIADFVATALPANASELTLSQIMTQKYIALYTNNETWSDLRRYDYSSDIFMGFTLPDTLALENNGKPAERWYPRQYSEVDWNSEALEKIGGLQPDFHTKPMWFTEPN